jgi:hypothetical protein
MMYMKEIVDMSNGYFTWEAGIYRSALYPIIVKFLVGEIRVNKVVRPDTQTLKVGTE